jgi:hypothetical protein
MILRRLVPFTVCALIGVACGARTQLSGGGGGGDAAASSDAGLDHVVKDVVSIDAPLADVSPPQTGCVVTSDDPSFGATEKIDACSEGQNISWPLDTNCGGGSVAWEYIPAHDLDVTRLELDVTGGGVALFDSAGDKPGAKLFEATLDSAGPQTWRGVDVTPPIHLTACHAYYIEQIVEGNGSSCSIATGGVPQRQFNPPGFGGTPDWSGPYIWLPWAAHVIGTCP